MEISIQEVIEPLFGKPCCRRSVGSGRSLAIGFGEKVFHNNPRLNTAYYGEWEIGTYNDAWRILQNGRIMCASNDPVDSMAELDSAVNKIELGCIRSLSDFANFDVRVELDDGIVIEFLAASSDDDECFHIFCPDKVCIVLNPRLGWAVGASNKPWKQG